MITAKEANILYRKNNEYYEKKEQELKEKKKLKLQKQINKHLKRIEILIKFYAKIGFFKITYDPIFSKINNENLVIAIREELRDLGYIVYTNTKRNCYDYEIEINWNIV